MKFLAPFLVCLGAFLGSLAGKAAAPELIDMGLVEPVLTEEPRAMSCDEASHEIALEYGCACMVTKPGGESICLFFPRHDRITL